MNKSIKKICNLVKLDYDKKFIYWNNEKYKRTPDKKIDYKGKLYIEGSPALPWEKAANKAEKKLINYG
jgi:hypothetical protein